MEAEPNDLTEGVSHRMTGLDLGPTYSQQSSRTSPPVKIKSFLNSSDEMLTTPKLLPDSAGGLLSPRGFPAKFQSPSAFIDGGKGSGANSSRFASSYGMNGMLGGGKQEDSLTTPVLTTPKTSDLWPQSARDAMCMDGFSAENLASPTPLELGPREPPKDLPMDSEIGLRSPCDGLLAKRRKFKLKQAASSNSVNSDSNSCDTPTSQNSPRDLSVVKNSGDEPCSSSAGSSTGSRVRASETIDMGEPLAKFPRRSDPRSKPTSPCDFKLPNAKPDIRFGYPLGSKEAYDMSSHYTPSPLTVPSPNWNVVERYLGGGDMLKTPKQLDGTFFDFLPTPSTPRSKFRDRSPGLDCYSGRDQRLSPRLSPRFPIPEAPTDLSSKDRSANSGGSRDPPPYPEAEDLSMGGSKAKVHHPPPPSPPVSALSSGASSSTLMTSSTSLPHHQQQQVYHHPQLSSLKQEYPQQHLTPPHGIDPRSRTPSGEVIKSEVTDDYEYGQGPPITSSSFGTASHRYFTPHLQSFYQRHLYGSNEDLPAAARSRNSPVPPSHHHLVHGNNYDAPPPPPYSGSGSQLWAPQPELNNSRPSSSQGHWHDEENSVSPPASMMYPSPAKIKEEVDEHDHNGGDPTNSQMKGKKRKVPGSKPGKSPPKNANGTKRVYTCPHCQRSYDWNYNLNRHLKYECGKENAFQCSKCGRKFPHKQNCVYHLKRKHKIVCETIDQYVASGLVVFRGPAGGGNGEGPNTGSPPSSSSSM